MIIKLAFRNIFRNFRRSLLSFLTISIGIGLSILLVGFSIGMEQQSIRLSIDTRTSHVKIYGKGYIEDDMTLPLDYTISDYNVVLNEIENIPEVVSASERILFSATLTDGIDELRIIGAGVDPGREDNAFRLSDYITDGTYLWNSEEHIVLSNIIANLFNVTTGDYLTLIARTQYGAITALDMEITGIYHSANPEVDNNYIFIPLETTQMLLEMDNKVTEIALFGNSMNESLILPEIISSHIEADLYDVVTWEYMARDLLRFYAMRANSRIIIYCILFTVAFASIMNTMLMSVYERFREIGTLMALGFRRSKITALFACEGLFLGVFGSTVGCLLGGGYTYYLKIHGIDFSKFGENGFGDIPIGSVIYADITMNVLIFFFITGICVALFSALYPSIKGARMEPSHALRSV